MLILEKNKIYEIETKRLFGRLASTVTLVITKNVQTDYYK